MPTSVHFYVDQLGFGLVQHSPHLGGSSPYHFHWCWLRFGTADLMLNSAYEFDEERPTREEHLHARPYRDVCLFFGCPNVDAAYSELSAHGIAIDQPPQIAPYGMKQMYFKDPDGFGLCFQWKAG